MDASLARSLRKLNDRTENINGELQTWSPVRLGYRPSDDAWSALDLLEHLRLTERAVLETMQRNLGSGNRVTLKDRFRSARVLAIMLLPTRLKVPGSVKSILPTRAPGDLAEIRIEWTHDRRRLADFLETLSGTDREEGVFRHPFGGWTTPRGALCFLRSHLCHHRYQLARLRRSSR